MSGFAPGDEVVCVDDSTEIGKCWHGDAPVRGRHYIVRGVGMSALDRIGVRLVGMTHNCFRPEVIRDGYYRADRFRPVRAETIAVFRQMCVSTKPLVEVD